MGTNGSELVEELAGCHTEDEEEDDDAGRLLSCWFEELGAYDVLVRFPALDVLRGAHGDASVMLQLQPWRLSVGERRSRGRRERERGRRVAAAEGEEEGRS